MKYKILVIGTLFLVISIFAIYHFRFQLNDSQLLGIPFEYSEVEIATTNIDAKFLKIEMSIWGTDYIDQTIFDDFKIYKIPEGYGENDWYLSYKDSLWASFRHFKTKNWRDELYQFHFFKTDKDSISCKVTITGSNYTESRVLILNQSRKPYIGSSKRHQQ
ncbi:MAG: hypothetical protein V4642_05220 [Bacteroidota bacterium]